MTVLENKYYKKQHITGPGHVLVSIKFSSSPIEEVTVTKKVAVSELNCEIKFDLQNHLTEILTGIEEANDEYGGNLVVQEIEIIPNDQPQKNQAKLAAYEIGKYLLLKQTT